MVTHNNRDVKETAFNTYQGAPYMTFFSEQEKWINKLRRLKEKYPDDVKNITENDDGSIVATCPASWMKFSPPRQISEEQKSAASERFKAIRQKRNEE